MKGASLIAPFGLRMPEELKEKIAERAKANGRSMNAEIVQILQDSLDPKPEPGRKTLTHYYHLDKTHFLEWQNFFEKKLDDSNDIDKAIKLLFHYKINSQCENKKLNEKMENKDKKDKDK